MQTPSRELLEFDVLIDEIRANSAYLSLSHTTQIYRAAFAEVIADPSDPLITVRIVEALRAGRGFSVIRMGDAEVNMAHYGTDDGTPALDLLAAMDSVRIQSDKFLLDENWLIALRMMMHHAMQSADILGVLGLWMGGGWESLDTERFIEGLRNDPRGMAGQWRGRRLLRYLGQDAGVLGRTAASAHLYLGVAQSLHALIDASKRVYCITSQDRVAAKLAERYPQRELCFIPVGRSARDAQGFTSEPFLKRTMDAIPADLSGSLCLVGAGIWAEYYCTMIKARGGVAVDIGSGFDLLDGLSTRPIHQRLDRGLLDTLRL